jgi:riboflavin kinase/FMN adenylyltransferase
MKVIYRLKEMPRFRNAVVAIGVFDGVHIAHRAILKKCVSLARRTASISLALTFWPHPQSQDSLYSLEHRLKTIRQLGIDECIVINFSKGFSLMQPEDFVEKILVAKLHARYVLVGGNFRFGKNGKGDIKLLKKLSDAYGFKLKVFGVMKIDQKAVSSTLIRRLISKGDFSRAQKLLSRPVSILGRVVKGNSIGKKLGFPTANIRPQHEVIPPDGIYAVTTILGNKEFPGVCYIGPRPTFFRAKKKSSFLIPNIEVYIFDFENDIYGKELEIQFIKKIRDDKRFDSGLSLAEQIKKDVLIAKNILKRPSKHHNISHH